jgi:phosphomannomutase / phosphoglucomutase
VSIYLPSDIRGDAASELTPELYRRWGFTLGSSVAPSEKFVVGGDLRASTLELVTGLIDGLCLSGVDCIDLGQLPTPMVNYARRRLQAAGSAIVTASHHPPAVNGLSWTIGGRGPSAAEVAQLAAGAQQPVAPSADRPASTPRTLDISFDYVAWLQETWIESLRTQLHIVLDPMHGCWSGRARRYLHAVFPECLISVVHDSAHAGFGGRSPDCSNPDDLQDLSEAVYRHRAHLGVAFDGDGDHVALVDQQGVPLSPEETTWILLRSHGRALRGRPFVYDAALSDRVPESARELGAEPVAAAGNRSSIVECMRQSGAAFGAAADGRYFFADLGGEDDALLAACRVIAFLASSGKSLAQLRRRCPAAFITPEFRLPAAAELQHEVLERVRQSWAEFPQHTLDGLRVDLPGGWALVRAGCPEPVLTLRFESCDWPALDHLVRQFCDALAPLGDDLWRRYSEWAGREG